MTNDHKVAIVRIDRVLSSDLDADDLIDKIVDIVSEIKTRDHKPWFFGSRIQNSNDPWGLTDDALCEMCES